MAIYYNLVFSPLGIYGWNVETSQDLIASEAEITHMPEPIVINSESESEEETSSENPSSNPCIKGA